MSGGGRRGSRGLPAPRVSETLSADAPRNPEAYESAACEMVRRTSTKRSPWHLIAGNDKRHARIEVLRIVCERVEDALQDRELGLPDPG